MNGYNPTHPWYYLLGGPILLPRTIKAYVALREYRGYRANDIAAADRLAEPKRSRRLDAIKAEVLEDLRKDMARYRHLACMLRTRRRGEGVPQNPCRSDDLDTAISLKFAHLYNGYGHLIYLESLTGRQFAFGF